MMSTGRERDINYITRNNEMNYTPQKYVTTTI